MLVTPVVSRSDRKRFIDLPYRLRRDVPQWVPPLRRDVAGCFDPDHPFYVHSEAAFFAADRDGAVVGRVGVHEDTIFNRVRNRRWAFFHLFEAEDESAAHAVIEAAATWARDRRLDRLVGPVGMLPGDPMGILVDGFDLPSALALEWHPPWYGPAFESAGFTKETDFLSGTIDTPFEVPAELFEMADAARREHGFSIKNITRRREVRDWAHAIGRIYNEAFVDNWEYRPVEPAEIRRVTDTFLPIVDPRLIVLLMHGTEPIGFLLILPDVADGMRKAGGRLLPLGWWHILRAARRTTVVDFEGLAVSPRFHGQGANMVIYADVVRRAGEFPRYRSAEMIRVDEGNARMQSNVAALGATWNRRHRVYGRDLGPRRSPA